MLNDENRKYQSPKNLKKEDYMMFGILVAVIVFQVLAVLKL